MQENEELEALLSLAKEDEEADARFVRELFLAEIYFLGEIVGEEDDEDPDAQISVVEWQTASGYHFVPAFTSLRMLEQGVSQDQPYIKVKAGDFLEAVRGNTVSINPGSSLERVISVDESEVLLSIFKPKVSVPKTKRKPEEVNMTNVEKKPVAVKKPAAKKPAAKKPVAKKPVAKKAVAKKPVAKKAVAKKVVAKKPAAKKVVAKKTATRKPVAKKAVARKVAAKKPAAKKSA
jgi:hypothetical protein